MCHLSHVYCKLFDIVTWAARLAPCDVDGETKHSSGTASKNPRTIAIEEFYSPDEYSERYYAIHQITGCRLVGWHQHHPLVANPVPTPRTAGTVHYEPNT